jgi:hypothetical protein
MNVICSKCKAYHWKAEQLARSSATNPHFGICYFGGKITLPSLHDLPPELRELYHGQDHIAKTFRDNICQYNKALAMTSVGQSPGVPVQMDHTINHGGGPWLYKIKGALHHYAGSLVPNPQRPPRFAQLYIYDPQESLEHRISANTELNPQILQILQDVLYRKHPSVQKFKQAYEQWKDIPNTHEFKIALRFDKACDKRRYNLPSAGVDEVAVILPGDGDQELYQRDIILFFRGGGL